MQPQLTSEEKAVVLEIIDLQYRLMDAEELEYQRYLALQPRSEMNPEEVVVAVEAALSEPIPLDPEICKQLICAGMFASNGAYRIALEDYGEVLESYADLSLVLTLAKAAILAGDREVAKIWAERAMGKLVPTLTVELSQQDAYHNKRLLQGLQLAKVFHLLGDLVHVESLRQQLRHLVFSETDLYSDIVWDSCRLAAELDFREEVHALCLRLAIVSVGFARGNLWSGCIGTLLEKGYAYLVWAIIGMAHDEPSQQRFQEVGIDEAVKRGQFALAIQFGARRGQDTKWSGLCCLAKQLVRLGSVSDWKVVWNLFSSDQRSFSGGPEILEFLAIIVEHCGQADRMEIYEYSDAQYRNLHFIRNDEVIKEVKALHLVICAWAGPVEAVRMLLEETRPARAFQWSMIRAALHRGWEFLVQSIWQDILAEPRSNAVDGLRLEMEKRKAGQPDRLEDVYASVKAMALKSERHPLMHSLEVFLWLEWKDMERYRSLVKEECIRSGSMRKAFRPIFVTAAKSGDLQTFYEETKDATFEWNVDWDLEKQLAICLRLRTGLEDGLEDF